MVLRHLDRDVGRLGLHGHAEHRLPVHVGSAVPRSALIAVAAVQAGLLRGKQTPKRAKARAREMGTLQQSPDFDFAFFDRKNKTWHTYVPDTQALKITAVWLMSVRCGTTYVGGEKRHRRRR